MDACESSAPLSDAGCLQGAFLKAVSPKGTTVDGVALPSVTKTPQIFGSQSGLPESGGWPLDVWIKCGKSELKRLLHTMENPALVPFRDRIMAVVECLCVVVDRCSSDFPGTASRALTTLNGMLTFGHTLCSYNSDPIVYVDTFNALCAYVENTLMCQIVNIPLIVNVLPDHPNKRLKANNDNVVNSNDVNTVDDFKRVENRKAARKSNMVEMGKTVDTSNKFESLNEVMDVSVENSGVNVSKSSIVDISDNNVSNNSDMIVVDNSGKNVLNNSNSVANINSNAGITSANISNGETVKPEPIFMKMVDNWREIYSAISERVGFEPKKKVNGDLLKIFPGSIDAYRAIQKFLSDNNHQFFGMRLKNERPRKVIIRGLPVDTPIEDVKAELIRLNFDVHRVSQMKNFKTKAKYPMFLCDLYINDAFKKVFEITEFLGFYVKITTYKFKGIKQCFKCQRYNHTSEICSLEPACVKCAGNHYSKDCTVKKPEELKCVNCLGNHTANFSLCSKNPKNFNSDNNITTFVSTSVKPGTSYSQAAGNNSTTNSAKTAKNKSTTKNYSKSNSTFYHSTSNSANNSPKISENNSARSSGSQATNQVLNISSAVSSIPELSQLDNTVNKLSQILNLLNQIATVSNSLKDNPLLRDIALNNVQMSTNQLQPPALP